MTWGVKEMTEGGGGMEGCSDDGHAAEQGHSGFEWVDQWRRKTSWLEVANIRCPKPITQPQVGTASALRLPPQYSPEPRRVQNLTTLALPDCRHQRSPLQASSFKFFKFLIQQCQKTFASATVCAVHLAMGEPSCFDCRASSVRHGVRWNDFK